MLAPTRTFTCFTGNRVIETASLNSVAKTLKKLIAKKTNESIFIFDNATGRSIDIDTRGSDAEMFARLELAYPPTAMEASGDESPESAAVESRGRGRPRLGVIAREITLLPRHWEWLGEQPGGASVALRKMVEEARRANAEKDKTRKAQERAYNFMSAIAGDLPGFEEASRALFANDPDKFSDLMKTWPEDIRDHAVHLAFGDVCVAN